MYKEVLIAANTPQGFVSHFDKYLNCDKVICLKGGSGVGKSTLLRQAIKIAKERNFHIVAVPCSSDYKSLDMVVIKELDTVILDSTAPHIIEPMAYGVIGEIFNLGDCLDKVRLREHKSELIKLLDDKAIVYSGLYNYLSIASKHIANVDSYYSAYLSQDVDKLVGRIISEHLAVASPSDDILPRFADYLEVSGLIDNTAKYIDGRVVVKIESPSLAIARKVIGKLAQYLDGNCIGYEKYYALMAPTELSGIGVGNIVVTTANCSAEFVYSLGNKESADGMRGKLSQIIEDRSSSQNAILRAADCLAKARDMHQTVEKYYYNAMNFDALDRAKNKLMTWIFD